MTDTQELSEYCRKIETYLCRRNGGHLIRIVGPAFEHVCDWAARGVPLTIVFRGIDQYCERREARGGSSRRPVRIEFCEADILELFDAWRRAVGVAPAAAGEEAPATPSRQGLGAHIDRAIARLTGLEMGERSAAFVQALDEIVRSLDEVRDRAKRARGDRRSALISRLDELDARLTDVAQRELSPEAADALRREAAEELAPFAARMPREAHARAVETAFARLVRESLGLPTLRWE